MFSEMALTVARQALQRSPCAENPTVNQIVVCATSLEHDLAFSCAGRLHSELGSTRAPFAIGQLQGVGAFLALQIAADMMAQDERMHTALIVGAERWRLPFARVVGSLTSALDCDMPWRRRGRRSGRTTESTRALGGAAPPQCIRVD
jgi:3-oxoacyl-[acyl-carrier-protein] synthase III